MTTLQVYTDGSCSPNPGKGGYAILYVITVDKEKPPIELKSGGSCIETTNNIMEMTAILNCLKFLSSEYRNTDIQIYSDSTYTIKGINEWRFKWKKNNWRRNKDELVKNSFLWIELDKYVDLFTNLKLIYVKAHTDDIKNHSQTIHEKRNCIVDKLAVEYRNRI